MKNYIRIIIVLLSIAATACTTEYPVDENGLLITTRTSAYMTSFELLDESHASVIIGKAAIDTISDPTMGIITAQVMYGTNMKNLKPYCSAALDAIVTPKMGVWTDFSNLLSPLTYTVISGNRLVKRPYKIIITIQTKP